MGCHRLTYHQKTPSKTESTPIFGMGKKQGSDYQVFGMQMPGRNGSTGDYRYGLNGMEKDDEVSGEGNSYTAEYWQYDSRLGRRWNIDPVVKIDESPYATFRNNPISYSDPDGDCPDCPDGNYEIQKGDNFWDLENTWGLDHGTLESLNPGLDPSDLAIGQSIVANADIPVNNSFNVSTTTTTMETQTVQEAQSRSYSGALIFAGTASAADGPLPFGEVAGGLALLGTAIYYAATDAPTISVDVDVPVTTTTSNPAPFNYVTYTKTNATTGEVYVGRSSGYGTPQQIVSSRDINHHMTTKGFGEAMVSTFAPATVPGGYATRAIDPSYWAVRGSEQLQIEGFRKAGISGNAINGIGPNNPKRADYIDAARKLFGN